MARELGVDPARLGPVYAGENTAALRREADDLDPARRRAR